MKKRQKHQKQQSWEQQPQQQQHSAAKEKHTKDRSSFAIEFAKYSLTHNFFLRTTYYIFICRTNPSGLREFRPRLSFYRKPNKTLQHTINCWVQFESEKKQNLTNWKKGRKKEGEETEGKKRNPKQSVQCLLCVRVRVSLCVVKATTESVVLRTEIAFEQKQKVEERPKQVKIKVSVPVRLQANRPSFWPLLRWFRLGMVPSVPSDTSRFSSDDVWRHIWQLVQNLANEMFSICICHSLPIRVLRSSSFTILFFVHLFYFFCATRLVIRGVFLVADMCLSKLNVFLCPCI